MSLFKKRPVAPWWRGAFLYQIYPRSFHDSNGDGIGDLPGITEKLDYIASLGVDGVWISPFFKSPMKDFGYDVSDYRDVDPIFGTLEDFDLLLKKAHDLNLKIIIDLVLNHTADQHPWFLESRKDKTNPKADWYVWADKIPNNWVSVFGGPAWTFDETRGQYYFHNFLKEQPDLNFHNPDVRQAALDIARFWLDKGVDGFRLDVVNFYFHDALLRDNPPRTYGAHYATQLESPDPYSEQQHVYDKSRPENLEFIKSFRALMDQYPDRFTVGEIGDDNPNERAAEYTASGLLDTCYNTSMMSGAHKDLTEDLIREPIEEFLNHRGHWPSWAFSNHDVVRAASRWHTPGDGFSHDPRLSKMLIALLGSLYGTAFLYQGEELGLPESRLKFEDLKDPWGIALYPKWQGRDGCRTPMPWHTTPPAKSWLPMPEDHNKMSVAIQEKDPASTLNFMRRFLAWRKTQSALCTDGEIKFIDMGDAKIIAFKRGTEETKIVTCFFNLSDKENSCDGSLMAPYGFSFFSGGEEVFSSSS
ncbi:MAG: alpha-amylase family glycosyl hydrolase [Alphaproteobacteria bacterium]